MGAGTQTCWGVIACLAVPYDGDRARVCKRRLEKKKINQKINKTLKSLQSTKQASSSSFAQKDSLLPLLMGLTPNIQEAKMGTHLRGFHLVERRQYLIWTKRNTLRAKFGNDIEVMGLGCCTYDQSVQLFVRIQKIKWSVNQCKWMTDSGWKE